MFCWQHQNRNQSQNADQTDHSEDLDRFHNTEETSPGKGANNVTSVFGNSEPTYPFCTPFSALVQHPGQSHWTINRCCQSMSQAQQHQFCRVFYGTIKKRHTSENQRSTYDPEPPSPTVREQTEQWFHPKTGHGRNRDDHS